MSRGTEKRNSSNMKEHPAKFQKPTSMGEDKKMGIFKDRSRHQKPTG